jgi:rhamnogalacturonyl hydrolase YesR
MSEMPGQGLSAEVLRRAAVTLTAFPFDVWRTGDAVGLEGLISFSELANEAEWRAWAHGFLKAWAARSQPFRESDDTAAGRAMCLVFEQTGDEVILDGAVRLAGYLMARRTIDGACVFREAAPLRRPYGGFALAPADERLLEDPGPCVLMNWLQMPLGFLSYLGHLTSDAALSNFAAEQALAQLGVLQDESGLLWHLWLERTGERYGLGWGRGQAWSLLGLLDVLEFLPALHQNRSALCGATETLAGAIADRQLADGGWAAVIVDAASPVEASTAALATAAFVKGVHIGVLGKDYLQSARRAWWSVCQRVSDDGVLRDVSGNIGASTLEAHYSNCPLGVVASWGQGPLLLAASAIGGLEE